MFQVRETWQDRDATVTAQGWREYTRSFRVVGSPLTKLIGPEVIRALPGIPRRGDLYVSAAGMMDAASWAREIEVRPEGDTPWIWIVNVRYSSEIDMNSQGVPGEDLTTIENPLLRPAEIEWDSREETYIPSEDMNRKPILNSADDPFNPPLEEIRALLVLRIVQNVPQFDPLDISEYFNAINSEPFLGFEQYKVRCSKLRANNARENGVSFWRRQLEFEIRTGDEPDDTWLRRVLDQGYRAFRDVNGEYGRHPVIDSQGNPLPEPALLDGNGEELLPENDPVFLEFRTLRRADFNELGII